MKRINLLLIVIITVFWAVAQEPFVEYYGGASSNYSSDMISTETGYYLLGFTEAGDNYDITLLDVDKYGQKRWDKTLGSNFEKSKVTGTLTTNQEIVIAAIPALESSVSDSIKVYKVDRNGNQIWQKTFGFELEQLSVCDIYETPNGEIVILIDTENKYFLLVAVDTDGNKVWDRQISFNDKDISANEMKKTANGFLIVGTCYVNDDDYDVLITKTDFEGVVQWQNSYGDAQYKERGTTVTELSDGYILIGGRNVTNKNLLMKVNSQGELQWYKSYDCYAHGGGPNDIIATPDRKIIMVGHVQVTTLYGSWQKAGQVLKMNSSGQLIFERRLEFNGFGSIKEIKQTPDLGFVLFANGYSVAEDYDMVLAKMDKDCLISIPETDKKSPSFKLYPNPAHSESTLSISDSDIEKHSLSLYNSLGQEVQSIPSFETNQISITKGDLHSGIYFVRIKKGEKLVGIEKLVFY